jgi:hypothetical protein
MKVDGIKKYFNILLLRWFALKPISKIIFASFLLLVPLAFFLVLKSTSSAYVFGRSNERH